MAEKSDETDRIPRWPIDGLQVIHRLTRCCLRGKVSEDFIRLPDGLLLLRVFLLMLVLVRVCIFRVINAEQSIQAVFAGV